MDELAHVPSQQSAEACARCAAQRKCEACFEELVRRFQSPLMHYLMRRTHSHHAAEDLLQETFMIAYREIARYEPTWRFSTWIFTIANRLAVTSWRRNKLAQDVVEQTKPPTSVDPSYELEVGEMRSKLWDSASDILEPDALAALWLNYVESLSAEEVGQVLGKSANAVRILLHRARAKLAQQLGATWRLPGAAS
jgi:RNA polymerase sigma-70 factor (ECF subfamily)